MDITPTKQGQSCGWLYHQDKLLVPDQDFHFALILWYIAKIISTL